METAENLDNSHEIIVKEEDSIKISNNLCDIDYDDSDDDIQTFSSVNHPFSSTSRSTNVQPFPKHSTTSAEQNSLKNLKAVVDLQNPGDINGSSTIDYDLNQLPDESKPWNIPGADVNDYFNYGFTEQTWQSYCHKQQLIRSTFTHDPKYDGVLYNDSLVMGLDRKITKESKQKFDDSDYVQQGLMGDSYSDNNFKRLGEDEYNYKYESRTDEKNLDYLDKRNNKENRGIDKYESRENVSRNDDRYYRKEESHRRRESKDRRDGSYRKRDKERSLQREDKYKKTEYEDRNYDRHRSKEKGRRLRERNDENIPGSNTKRHDSSEKYQMEKSSNGKIYNEESIDKERKSHRRYSKERGENKVGRDSHYKSQVDEKRKRRDKLRSHNSDEKKDKYRKRSRSHTKKTSRH